MRRLLGRLTVSLDLRDWWMGVAVGSDDVYVCPLPCVVVRYRRRDWWLR